MNNRFNKLKIFKNAKTNIQKLITITIKTYFKTNKNTMNEFIKNKDKIFNEFKKDVVDKNISNQDNNNISNNENSSNTSTEDNQSKSTSWFLSKLWILSKFWNKNNNNNKNSNISDDNPLKWTFWWNKSIKEHLELIKNSWIEYLKNMNYKNVTMILIWLTTLSLVYYTYNQDIYNKIQKIPTNNKNIEILNEKINKQQEEISYLEQLKVSDEELERKEKTIDKYLPNYSQQLTFNQAYKIFQLAKWMNFKIDSFQKNEEQNTPQKIKENAMYSDVWYVKYSIESSSSEELIMEFIEEIEKTNEFMVETYSLVRGSNGEVSYNIMLKGFYFMKDEGEDDKGGEKYK